MDEQRDGMERVLRALGFQPISHGYGYLWSNGYRLVDLRSV
jgi:hypothetical protein